MTTTNDCPVCHGAGEVTYSTTPSIDPRDPRHEDRTDPCGDCEGSGVAPVGAYVEPWVEEGEHATADADDPMWA
jgi:hypothetical protein